MGRRGDRDRDRGGERGREEGECFLVLVNVGWCWFSIGIRRGEAVWMGKKTSCSLCVQ